MSLTTADRQRLGRRAQLLVGVSVTYNLLAAAVALAAGATTSSLALVAFGPDSLVEVSSGLIIRWQFHPAVPENREHQALTLIGISFFALAAYVGVESTRNLLGPGEASPSPVGIALAAASLLIMPFLSWTQRRTGRALGSGSVAADSSQTLLCSYLSAVLLAGLLLNATLGWGGAGPLAGLVIASVAVREGRDAWRGEACGCGPTQIDANQHGSAIGSCDDGCRCGDGCATTVDTRGHSDPRSAAGGVP